jgi:Fe-S cluster biosynthesis and repair protein YggX
VGGARDPYDLDVPTTMECDMRMVQCVKLSKELPALEKAPMPGELGKRIFEHVSAEAWEMWLEHQKMIMNEYRIDLSDKSSRQILKTQCEQFFFGEGASLPAEYVPQHK